MLNAACSVQIPNPTVVYNCMSLKTSHAFELNQLKGLENCLECYNRSGGVALNV